jgi:hypothetical protein
VELGVTEGNFPKLVVARDGEFLLIAPGESLELRESAPWERGAVEGFLKSLPPSWESVLVLLGIFFYRRKLNELLFQWLTFFAAQLLALALLSVGAIGFAGPGSRLCFGIALVALGVWNFFPEKGGTPLRLILVAILGFLHGVSLAVKLRGFVDLERWLSHVFALSLGIGLAQLLVLVAVWLCTLKWHHHESFQWTRLAGSGLVVLMGACLAVN